MFREMRRKKQQLTDEEAVLILKNASSGVLALSGDDGYPYAVPLSFVYDNSKIYFHCAKTGHKIDAVKRNNKASFCVIERDDVVAKKFLTLYRSVIVFGKTRILEDDDEKRHAIEILAKKYSPNLKSEREEEIKKEFDRLCMIEMTVEHITGKEALELTLEKTCNKD